ncbi:hypothetical protein [Pyxidicoccus xibeiensis]|uniref:hypothetical protein n=1 Tax=Pyxidicoccus xibeiensis TaxID=2906759 RepID=UPI0020A76763|nr:hypothetical protein [Pyxidicoccus xibeiensis]MCP3143251.1 hypothetical protein [Pyxidicoccus xibeiensis]
MSISVLRKSFQQQLGQSGSVTLDESISKVFPVAPEELRALARYLGQDALTLRSASLYPQEKRPRTRHLKPRHESYSRAVEPGSRSARLYQLLKALERSGHSVSIRKEGQRRVIQVNETQWLPYKLLKFFDRSERRASAKLRARTRKEEKQLRAELHDDAPTYLEASGIVEHFHSGIMHSYRLVARFFMESGKPGYFIQLSLPPTPLVELLRTAYHPELRALTFLDAALILSSSSVLGTSDRIPVWKGLHFYTNFQFGPQLQSVIVPDCPLTLIGELDASRPGLSLVSTPFTLRMGDTTLDSVTLSLTGHRNIDSEDFESVALLRALWNPGSLHIPLYSPLPPDTGVIGWNTDPKFSLQVPDLETLAPLSWNWKDWWQKHPRLEALVAPAPPPAQANVSGGMLLENEGEAPAMNLTEVHLGMDLGTQQVSDVSFTLTGADLTLANVQLAKLSRARVAVLINQPADASGRSLLVEAEVELEIAGLKFNAVLTAPDFVIRASADDSVTFEQLSSRLLQYLVPADEEPSDPGNWREVGPVQMDTEEDPVPDAGDAEGEDAILEEETYLGFFITLDPFRETFQVELLNQDGERSVYRLARK